MDSHKKLFVHEYYKFFNIDSIEDHPKFPDLNYENMVTAEVRFSYLNII